MQTEPKASLAPRIHAITLGVDDLERSLAFYRDGLGFPAQGVIGTEFAGDERTPPGDVIMMTLEDGLILSLFPRTSLTRDAGVASLPRGSCVSLGHFVETREEVDRLLDLAAAAGARVPGPPHDRPWGAYSGYFSDPDGHLWEMVHFTTATSNTG